MLEFGEGSSERNDHVLSRCALERMELIVRNNVCARPSSCHFTNSGKNAVEVIADLRGGDLHDSDFV